MKLVKIGKASELLGVSIQTLHHWEASGELVPSKTGRLINADVNGAINILRKEIGDHFVRNGINKGIVNMPKRVNPLALECRLRLAEVHSIAA